MFGDNNQLAWLHVSYKNALLKIIKYLKIGGYSLNKVIVIIAQRCLFWKSISPANWHL